MKKLRHAIRTRYPRLWKFAKRSRNKLYRVVKMVNIYLRLSEITRAIQFNARIDLVERDGFLLFCYVGDHFYKNIIPHKNKRKTYRDFKEITLPEYVSSLKTPGDYINNWCSPKNADLYLLAHLLKYMEKLTVIDVGCLYGFTTLSYARFMRRLGAENRIICLDPGRGAELALYNFENNGYDNIEFYPYAAGNYDGYLPIHAEPGENENNRIVNPQQYDFSVSRIKKGVSLDRFLDEINCDSDLFIKMDTQGAEPEVFEGLENTNKARKIAGILEFFPQGYRKRIKPEEFLDMLLDQFDLFELGARRNKLVKLEHGASEQLVENIYLGEFSWTDLLFISSKIPEKERLIEGLTK